MKLTETQKLLMTGLKVFGVENDLIVGIMLMLQEEDQQEQLMEWMAEHEGAKPEVILQTATEIAA